MKKLYAISLLLILPAIVSGCSDDNRIDIENPDGTQSTTTEIFYANVFASDVLGDVYLWTDEISDDIAQLDPYTNEDPISTVKEIRYKENGKDVDKWTQLTDDYESFTNSLSGIETTFGYGLKRCALTDSDGNETGKYCLIVAYVYDDSPAQNAGMRRGDIILTLDGESIMTDNYLNAFNNSSVTLGMASYDEATNTVYSNGKEISLTAVTMYENSILVYKTFDCDGKTVGYLAYSSFDMISLPDVVDVCKEFKSEGVSELILDLRYNGGGYVTTETAIASMLVPESEVEAKSIFQTAVWNDAYMVYYEEKGTDLNTYFGTSFKVYDEDNNKVTVSTRNANIGLDKIYALITTNTASASEGLLIGLMPYMDIELIGSTSSGKYCAGSVLSPGDVYTSVPDEISNWGIYVMTNRYADCNGDNPCMPDGLTPDTEATDNALDGCQLGDEQETMLKVALQLAGKTDWGDSTRGSLSALKMKAEFISVSPLAGKCINEDTKGNVRKQ